MNYSDSLERYYIIMKKKLTMRPFDYYALLFFITAFAGWLWEVLLYLITDHTFVNRGVYRGPYLPIYGIGCVTLILLLHKMRKHPILVFVCSCLLCSTLEYFSGVWLEKKWGTRWWDYSQHLFNFQGHICLVSAVGFGVGGVFLICIIQPIFNRFYHHMIIKLRITLCVLFLLIFIADATYSATIPNTGININTFSPCISVVHVLQSLQTVKIVN